MIRIFVISLYLAQKYPMTEATLRGSRRNAPTPFLMRKRSSSFSMTEIFWVRIADSGTVGEKTVPGCYQCLYHILNGGEGEEVAEFLLVKFLSAPDEVPLCIGRVHVVPDHPEDRP